jgi:secreted PhoX family phosphatase
MRTPAALRRRQFLRLGLALAGTIVASGSPWRRALAALPAVGGPSPYGPLQPPDANGLRLPAGFGSRVIALGNQPVAATGYVWHIYSDGAATFRIPGEDGWILVSNSESLPFPVINSGGASAIRFDSNGEIVDAYKILSDTLINCAGGATPWGTWLSCEEIDVGLVWECDPLGVAEAQPLPAMGRFQHEAVAVDGWEKRLYLTEDVPDGRFYRFTPAVWQELGAGGLLEVAEVDAGGQVAWHPVPEPDPADVNANPTRLQVPASTAFAGGEGIVWHQGRVFFTTKGDNRVWVYTPRTQQLGLVYDDGLDPAVQLTGVDNILAARSGDLIVAEDQSSLQQLVLITPEGVASPLVEINQVNSELTGPTFDPSGQRLYVASQRGPAQGGLGVIYEISGPFRGPAAGPACGWRNQPLPS